MRLRIAVLVVLTVIFTGILYAQLPNPTAIQPGVRVNTEIPLWGLAGAGISLIGAWFVAMFRINTFGKYHKLHFEHAKDQDSHWTSREREDLDRRLTEIYDCVKPGSRK